MIRRIDEKGLPECLRVIHKGYEPTAIRFGLTGDNCPHRGRADLPLSVLADELSSGAEMYGYCAANRIIGFVSIVVGQAEIKINDIVVLPECWNQGVGTALLEFVKKRAVEAKVSKIALGMIDDNERLRSWYEKHGFVNVGYRQYPKAPFLVGYMEWSMR